MAAAPAVNMLKSRLLHNIVLALIVAGLALFLLLKPEKAGPQKFALSRLRGEAVTRISLAPAGRETIVLEKRGDAWQMTAPLAARADRFRVDALLGLLGAQSEIRLPASDLARFDLAPPFLRLQIGAQEFAFGGRQPVTNQIYVATGGHVYLLSAAYLVDVSRGAEDFLARTLLAGDETPVGFTLPGLKLRQKDGRWEREPDDGRLSADLLNRFADEWKLATAMSVAKATAAKPLARLQVSLADGRKLEFSLLAREPELVLRREDEGLEYRFAPDAGARLLEPSRLQPGDVR